MILLIKKEEEKELLSMVREYKKLFKALGMAGQIIEASAGNLNSRDNEERLLNRIGILKINIL